MKGVAGVVLALLLGGCAVVSEKPLFADKDASPAQLAQGLWALSGPGCEVGPLPAGKGIPECALPLTVAPGRITMDLAEWMRSLAPSAGSASPLSPATSAVPSGPFLLVAGDPLILQMLPPPGSPTTTTSYLALRALHANGAGQIDRAVLWPVICPDKPASQPGFVATQVGCTAQSAEAVRAQAVHMKPLMSYFLTWIRAETTAASAAADVSPAALALARRWEAVDGSSGLEDFVGAYDPAYLASQAHIASPRNDAALVQAAHEAVAAASPGFRESLARVLATSYGEDALRNMVTFEESPAGKAARKNRPLVGQRRKALAQIAWPRYRALFEASLCRTLDCSSKPGADPGAIDWKSPNPAQPSIDAADAYLRAEEGDGRPNAEIGADEFIPLLDEGPAFRQANPSVSASVYNAAANQAKAAVAAQLGPDYRRQIVLIYASLFTADELKAMARNQTAVAALPLNVMAAVQMGGVVGGAQRALFADIKARYCQKAACA